MSTAGKIQISQDTNMLLDMVGGYITTERGDIEVKGKGMLKTFWLDGHDYNRMQQVVTLIESLG